MVAVTMASDSGGGASEADLRQNMMKEIGDTTPVPVSLAFGAATGYLAVGTRTGQVMIWDTASSRLVAEWTPHAGERERLLRVASDMMDKAADDPFQALIMPTVVANRLSVYSVAFSPAEALLCTADASGSVQVRTLHGRYLTGWTPDQKATRWAGYCQDERVIASLNEGKGLMTYDVFTEQHSSVIPLGDRGFSWDSPFAVAPGAQLLAIADRDTISVHRAGQEPLSHPTAYWRDPKLLRIADESPDYGADSVRTLAWSGDQTVLATADSHGLIRRWAVGDRLRPVHACVPPVSGRVAWLGLRGGAFVAVVVVSDGRLALWDLAGEPVLLEDMGARAPQDVTVVTICETVNILIAGFNTGEIAIWYAGTGARVGSLHPVGASSSI
jgi:WD40 repeat protein